MSIFKLFHDLFKSQLRPNIICADICYFESLKTLRGSAPQINECEALWLGSKKQLGLLLLYYFIFCPAESFLKLLDFITGLTMEPPRYLKVSINYLENAQEFLASIENMNLSQIITL
uniref:Uncharacterized protein n=1 Tax=Micrurus lemniscatus lemniscatus TaxID=129467 RepID=A0A2D4JM58_MICLE